MQAIIDFFVGIGNVIVTLIEFVINVISDLIYVVGLLGSLVLQLPNLIGWLPSACITLVVTLFSIVVIYKILGREG